MDFSLKCNSLKCRSSLIDRAVVTTCRSALSIEPPDSQDQRTDNTSSHIFCKKCSRDLGLTAPPGRGRHCPACQSVLANPDDVVSSSLNPTEDYKTSVLSGLAPSTVMECAGRALAFWSYQSTQEIVYQEYLAKTLTDKYGNLNVQMDKIINDANSELEVLNQKLNNLQTDHERLQNENSRLAAAFHEKNRKHQQTQELYDRLKRKEMTAVTQSAASQSVDHILGRGSIGQVTGRPSKILGDQQASRSHPEYQSLESITNQDENFGVHRRHSSTHSHSSNGRMPPPPPRRPSAYETKALLGVKSTPSGHRTQLGIPGYSPDRQSAEYNNPSGTMQPSQINRAPSQRQHSSYINPMNISRHGSSGYGMSAGMKIGTVSNSRFNPSPRVDATIPRFTIDHQYQQAGGM